MANETERWFPPDSGYLTYPYGPEYTADEFARQTRPPCPICGTEVMVDPGDGSHMHAREPVMYIPRGWECPQQGCAEGLARADQP
jgi:hypothetical protein